MRNKRRLGWLSVPLAATLLLVLGGCTQSASRGFLPGPTDNQPVTNHTDMVTSLWVTSWIVLLAVGVTTWGLAIYALIAFRRRKGQTGLPPQLRYNMPIEVFYTIVPFILILGFFAFTDKAQTQIEQRYAAGQVDVEVEVVAKQWAWDFNYVNENVYEPGIQGQPLGKSLDVNNLPTLWLPVDKNIEIKITSRDVIHSFWVVDFLYKKDAIPGRVNYMSVKPLRIGDYEGKCAELCGQYHSAMLFNVKVVSWDDYEQHMAQLKAKGYSGQLSDQYNRDQNLPGNTAPPKENAAS